MCLPAIKIQLFGVYVSRQLGGSLLCCSEAARMCVYIYIIYIHTYSTYTHTDIYIYISCVCIIM